MKEYQDEEQIQGHNQRTRANVHVAVWCSSFRAYCECEYGKPEHEFRGNARGERPTLGISPSSPPPPSASLARISIGATQGGGETLREVPDESGQATGL